MSDQLLTLRDVEQRLAVARKTVLLLIAKGKLSALKVGRQWRFEPADVDAYIEAQKVAATPTPTARELKRPRTNGGEVNWKGAQYYQH